MTRFLSEALRAPEPYFRLSLRRLENANGRPGTDIRLSSEVQRATLTKIRQLGLDPQNTTPEELYHALQRRLEADDQRLTRTLQSRAASHVSAEGDVVAGMIHALRELPDSKRCFALKASTLKSLIKTLPPHKALKRLGYRSLDSCLKHETPVLILTAAWLSENDNWRKRWQDQYKKLRPGDFEDRTLQLLEPTAARWQQLAAEVMTQYKHNLLSFRECGALVFLPLPRDIPTGAVTASLGLALHELNEIRAGSTFLKLAQLQPDFGKMVRTVAEDEPQLQSQLLDQPVPWRLIQHYYARLAHHFREDIFEPYIQAEDMVWQPIEKTLREIEPSFEFWQHSGHLALLQDRQPVSLNVVDAALNCCNKLPFEQRLVHYFRNSLWHELLLRYLQHDTVEQTVLNELQPHLAEAGAVGNQ